MSTTVKTESSKGGIIFWIKILVSVAVFVAIQASPIPGLESAQKTILALLATMIVLWMTQPIPWAITGLLPLIVLPISGAVKMSTVAGAYGNNNLFILMTILLFGYAAGKSGLAKRIALSLLNIRWVGCSTNRILFTTMAACAIVSAFIDDAAAMAMFLPIGHALVDYAADVRTKLGKDANVKKLKGFITLGILYASEAGGLMTVAGIPHIPVALSLLEASTSYRVNFVQWSSVGIVLGIVSLVVYYFILQIFLKPEFTVIEDANIYFQGEKLALGGVTKVERNTMVVMFVMAFLWILPVFYSGFSWLDFYIVPVIGVVLLYVLPTDAKTGKSFMTVKDFCDGIPWNAVWMVVSAVAMSTMIKSNGIMDWVKSIIPADLSGSALLAVTAIGVPIATNLTSGIATVNLFGSICLPIAEAIGYNAAIIAFLIPATGMAIGLPWAGTCASMAFSSGAVDLKTMAKLGIIATIVHAIVCTILCVVLVPLFHAYTFVG